MVQRKGNMWNSSMYVLCPANQQPRQQQSRSRRHLDHNDSEGPSGESAGPSGNISGHRRVTTSLPATGRCQPSAYEDDKGKDLPPRKNRRTWTPANRQQQGNTSTTMENISGISATSPACDDEEDEPQATPPRTKGPRGALARKIPPTKLPPMRWTTTRRRGWQTTRDKLLEAQPQTKCKNKQPLSGVPNFKNRPLLPISADDLDDDQLGITQRTPPHHHNSRNRPADTVLHISQNSEDGTQEAGPSVQAPKEKKNKHKKRKWEASPPGRRTPADSFARKETQGKEKKAQTPSSISGKSGRARTASTPS